MGPNLVTAIIPYPSITAIIPFEPIDFYDLAVQEKKKTLKSLSEELDHLGTHDCQVEEELESIVNRFEQASQGFEHVLKDEIAEIKEKILSKKISLLTSKWLNMGGMLEYLMMPYPCNPMGPYYQVFAFGTRLSYESVGAHIDERIRHDVRRRLYAAACDDDHELKDDPRYDHWDFFSHRTKLESQRLAEQILKKNEKWQSELKVLMSFKGSLVQYE